MPGAALTVGLRTLLDARELLMLVSGAAKAEALGAMLDGPEDPDCPASLLRDHPGLTVICDAAAAFHLQPRPESASDRALIVLGHREAGVSAEGRISDESLARLQTARRSTLTDRPRVVIFTGYSHTAGGRSEAEQMKSAWDSVRRSRPCSRSPGATRPRTHRARCRSCGRSAPSAGNGRHLGLAHPGSVLLRPVPAARDSPVVPLHLARDHPRRARRGACGPAADAPPASPGAGGDAPAAGGRPGVDRGGPDRRC